MEIKTAESAGFCFGVNRAVELTYSLLQQHKSVVTLGPLIHNPQCVADLAAHGAVTAENVQQVPSGSEVVIRSHGVPRSVYAVLQQKGCVIHDATCPFVAKIHALAAQAGQQGALLLVAGDKTHPEVQGIVGHTDGEVFVFADEQELEQILTPQNARKSVFFVAQTTFEIEKWELCTSTAKKLCTNAQIFDTICGATWTRQKEAVQLAQECDVIIVIGGRHSSNTQKLVSVAQKYATVHQVETAAELDLAWFRGVQKAGVTAGASTPASIIKEVLNKMSEVNHNEEMSFEELLNAQPDTKPFAGKIVKGIVTNVSPNEVQVDIGAKYTGIVKLEDLTNDTAAKAEDLVKKGDELELLVIKTNDVDGIAYLSKKRLDETKGKEEVAKAAEDGTVMHGHVAKFNNGGLEVMVNNVRVFVPRSQSTLRYGDDYTKMVGQDVDLIITQCEGRHIVGNIRAVMAQKADAAREVVWSTIEVGKRYAGVVKSLTNYGAFIDIGGVDGLLHISEMSWNRIKHPSEVFSVGDEVEVFVKELDAESKKISLGYRKAEDNPWEKLKNEYAVGAEFTAPVVSITKFGAFVRILPGVDGLVHISEIAHEHVENVADALKVGDEVKVKLTDVDFDKKRVSLSIKALLEAPAKAEETAEEADAE